MPDGSAYDITLRRVTRDRRGQVSRVILCRGGYFRQALTPLLGTGGTTMTDQGYQELSRTKRRRLIFRAVLRSLLSTIVLVVLYYQLPLDRPWDADTGVRVLVGLLVFVGVAAWQVRTITGSRYPGVKAVEALSLIFPLYLLVFASTYFVMQRASAGNFTEPLTRTDALYFSVTVFSTVGFGDIAPKSEAARVVLIVQMLGDLAILGAGARILLGAVRRGQQRRSDPGDDVSQAVR
jgi:ion channel